MFRIPLPHRVCGAIVAIVFLSCQNNPNRIGMPAHFAGKVPDTITVMSYNVENLFDMVDNGDEYPEYKPGACNWTETTFREKLSNIASVIAAVHPHIAVLVEVENENTVRELRRACAQQSCPFPYFAIGDQTSGSNTRPVIMSTLPVLWENSFGMVPGVTHERPMLEAAVYCGSDTLIVFACHWPSKKNPESRRVERAEMLAKRLDALSPAQDYIVAGDLNENFDESETFHTAGLDDTHGRTGINHVLGTMSSRPLEQARYVDEADLSQKRATGLFDPWNTVTDQQRFSEMFEGRRETPDHILLPASLFDEKGLSYVEGSFHPFTWNGRLIKDGVPYRWQMRYVKHQRIHVGDGFSDHVPVVVRLVKGAFCMHGRDTGAIDTKEFAAEKKGGFEAGPDGFIGCSKKIDVERDTLMPKSGRYCLRICGTASSNGCAARARISAPAGCGVRESVLSLWMRGAGTFNVRCKAPGSKQWTYFVGEAFSQARGGKYADYNFAKWKTIRLPLHTLSSDASDVDFEIRSKKGRELKVWIDDVALLCRE